MGLGAVATEVVLVMARVPSPGRVKTRLAATLGDRWACRIYRAFIADRADALRDGCWQLIWAVEPAGGELGGIFGAASSVVPQRGRDLGERMHNGFRDLFDAGAKRVVMIGADAPHLGHSTFSAAFAALHDSDVVLVPSADGGYCLIGLKAPVDLFTGVEMSTSAVFDRTRCRIEALGLSLHCLPESFDVDELPDLARLAEEESRGSVKLPRTAAILRELHASGLLPRTGSIASEVRRR